MKSSEIREPIQKRSIEKKEKIIKVGFELICKQGYHNTNTAEIAKAAGVSTGIVYQYFEDKYDIFTAGLKKYGDTFFQTIETFCDTQFEKTELPSIIGSIIDRSIEMHKKFEPMHQELTALSKLHNEINDYFYDGELSLTYKIADKLKDLGFADVNLIEKSHIIVGMVDTLCHEVAYHKHEGIDYDAMKKIVINNIIRLLES